MDFLKSISIAASGLRAQAGRMRVIAENGVITLEWPWAPADRAVLRARDALDRLHFTAPAGVVAPVGVAAAVLVEEPLSSAGLKAVLVAVLLIVTTPVLSHATARAARIREHGRWRVLPHELEDSGEDAR